MCLTSTKSVGVMYSIYYLFFAEIQIILTFHGLDVIKFNSFFIRFQRFQTKILYKLDFLDNQLSLNVFFLDSIKNSNKVEQDQTCLLLFNLIRIQMKTINNKWKYVTLRKCNLMQTWNKFDYLNCFHVSKTRKNGNQDSF